MSIKIQEHAKGKVLEVQATGKLTKKAYETFVPLTEKKIQEFGKIRILLVLHDFDGWSAGALWEDLKFDIHHFKDIERLAIVGDEAWEKGMAVFCRPFTAAKVQYFGQHHLGKARAWVLE